MDEGKIYKQKLALLGDCFKILVRKVRSRDMIIPLNSISIRHRKQVNDGEILRHNWMNKSSI
jgi:hypothetical protein